MKDPAKPRNPAIHTRSGPIAPGTPLYRALEMVARQIAKAASRDKPHDSGQDTIPLRSP